MITDREAYRRLCDDERWRHLQNQTVEESIAIGEALLTSELMDVAVFPDDDRPQCFAIALGLARDARSLPQTRRPIEID